MNKLKIISLLSLLFTMYSCEQDTSDPCRGNYNYAENKSWLHNIENKSEGMPISSIDRYIQELNKENNYLYIFTYGERDEFTYKIFDCSGNQIEQEKKELEFAELQTYGYLKDFNLDETIVTF